MFFRFLLYLCVRWRVTKTAGGPWRDVDGRVSGEQSIDLRLHVVVGRNDVEEILDDAKIEIDAEGIGRQCNPTACHAVGEHRTDGFWNGILLLIV